MKFSLLLATVGRTAELERFVSSLHAQSYRDFELILVDGNADESLATLLRPYAGRFPLLHIKELAPGLSKARNAGLPHVSGDVVAFPDDDCWYPPDLLRDVKLWLEANVAYDGLSVISRDDSGRPSNGHWNSQHGVIHRYNVWQTAISYSFFLRRQVADAVGPFDESLGASAGTAWGSGEETDYLIRALQAGCRLYYEPALSVGHPQFRENAPGILRGYSAGVGLGHLLRKHRYPFWYASYCWVRSLGGALLALAQFRFVRARRHWVALQGRIRGWWIS